jgi:hypothetical protein
MDAPVVLTQGSDTSVADPKSTGSITCTAGRVQLLVVRNGAVPTATPVVTGCGRRWVPIATVDFSTIASPGIRLIVYRAMVGTTDTGTLSMTPTPSGVRWAVVEVSGVATTGDDGADAIVQVATAVSDSTSTLAATLASAILPSNGVVAFFADGGSGGSYTIRQEPGSTKR